MSGYDERHGSSRGRHFPERHEPYAWHEPTDRPEPHEGDHEQHAGNATVNHRPEDQGRAEAEPDHVASGPRTDRHGDLFAGRDRLAAVLRGLGPDSGVPEAHQPDRPDPALEDLGSDERALRRMLHEVVRDIEPREGSLQHLRRAVPARRARKRQAAVGMAAAALFIGTAIPALVHVSNADGSDADPSAVAHASQAQGGTGQGKGQSSGSSGSTGSSGTATDRDKDDPKGANDKGKGAIGGAAGEADPTASAQGAPACTAAQLGGASANGGAPDSTGTVYGTFRVANVSSASCTVSDTGSVSTVAQGAADPAKISVLNHVAGDAATALPAPSQDVTSLVLTPGAAYEVKFAWVPAETCPTVGGGTGGPSPDPSPTSSSGDSGGTSTQTGDVSPQLATEDGAADGSVLVSHTWAGGSGTATTVIPNACAGTVYRTGILTTP